MTGKRIMVTAEIPEELLEEWRLFVVLHGGKVLIPREHNKEDKDEQTV